MNNLKDAADRVYIFLLMMLLLLIELFKIAYLFLISPLMLLMTIFSHKLFKVVLGAIQTSTKVNAVNEALNNDSH